MKRDATRDAMEAALARAGATLVAHAANGGCGCGTCGAPDEWCWSTTDIVPSPPGVASAWRSKAPPFALDPASAAAACGPVESRAAPLAAAVSAAGTTPAQGIAATASIGWAKVRVSGTVAELLALWSGFALGSLPCEPFEVSFPCGLEFGAASVAGATGIPEVEETISCSDGTASPIATGFAAAFVVAAAAVSSAAEDLEPDCAAALFDAGPGPGTPVLATSAAASTGCEGNALMSATFAGRFAEFAKLAPCARTSLWTTFGWPAEFWDCGARVGTGLNVATASRVELAGCALALKSASKALSATGGGTTMVGAFGWGGGAAVLSWFSCGAAADFCFSTLARGASTVDTGCGNVWLRAS